MKTELDELDKELRYLERIEETEIRVPYSFGRPPTFSSEVPVKIIDFGEFSMKMERPAKMSAKE